MSSVSELDATSSERLDKMFDSNMLRKPPQSYLCQLDYVPLVSTITGAVRIVFGLLETVFGIFVLPLDLVRNIFVGVNHQFTLTDGLANIFRGYVAAHPIAGNVALYLYDTSRLFN